MTQPDDIGQENWEALLEAGPAIAIAVASAAGSGRQTEDELGAFVDAVATALVAHDRDTLLGRLVGDLHGRLAAGWRPDVADPLTDGLHAARRAGAILAVSGDPEGAEAVREWLLGVARTVAEARREGGVLGIGAEEVSEHETATLESIADALGATAPD